MSLCERSKLGEVVKTSTASDTFLVSLPSLPPVPIGLLQEGRTQDGALRLPPPPSFALADASSLLWRMDVLGVETGAHRWRGVSEASFKRLLK